MKRAKNLNEKIYVKRIWVDKGTYDYIFIPEQQFNDVVKDQEKDKELGKHRYMLLEKAPLLFRTYKAFKPAVVKWWIIIATAIISAIITIIVDHLFR